VNPLADRRLLVACPLLGLLAGALLWWVGGRPEVALAMGTLPVLVLLVAEMVRSLRQGAFGLDLIAALAMAAGLAMGEPLAACIVALMYAGGQYLEDYAHRRAGAEMTALLARQPRTALRHDDGALTEIPIEDIAVGDLLLIRRGAVLPVDGTLASPLAMLDTAALTGEPMPVRVTEGEAMLSGCANAGDAFDLRATTDAGASTYAGIVRMVRAAADSRAPMARLADQWSVGFLLLTLAMAGGAWALTGEAQRALAVLVIATPCPLILAVPVALLAGLSRTAKLGVLVKSAAVLEAMARIRVLVIDKTGTITAGAPSLVAMEGPEEALRLAASLDQASEHPIARALVAAARARGLALSVPEEVHETPGEGLTGLVEGRRVAVGGPNWVAEMTGAPALPLPAGKVPEGAMRCAIALDGAQAATLVFADQLRPDAIATIATLRAQGIRRIILASGDANAPVRAAGAAIGADAAHARQSPADKVALIAAARPEGPVLMLGDGLNDAPALAAADVGVAVATKGAAAAEAADAVLLVDGLAHLAGTLAAARRARAIALQSVTIGIGLSSLGMVLAAFGYLSPVQGALIQEAIDVAVILNALRALTD
jgi:heavy metal translocating P-type ATPase